MSAKPKTKSVNFQQAKDFLGNKQSKKIAHNTEVIQLSDDQIIVTYHGNTVVRFYPNKNVYSSCGWHTPTTKERLNWFLPYGCNIYQEQFAWYFEKWHYDDQTGRVIDEKSSFYDGFTLINPA